jgi:DNA-binding transcriptional regulator LsrR (DeoR family)
VSDLTPFDVARAYWSLPPATRQWAEVARRLGRDPADKILQNRLGRLARQWEEQGLVRHIVLSEPSPLDYLPRVPELENQLRQRFPLRDAVVVDVSVLRPGPDAPMDRAEHDRHDNQVHEALGAWAARVFMSLMRPGDVLGVGGGRGPYYAVRNCRFRGGLDHPQVVVSLSGQMSANVWGEVARLEVASMDADQVASRLGGEVGAKDVIRVNAPIASARPRGRKGARIRIASVTLALIGIGALAGGHRLRHYEQSQELESVRSLLKSLCQRAQALDADWGEEDGVQRHWVADLCNHLFLTTSGSADWKKVGKADRTEMERAVRELNSRFLSPEPADFVEVCRRGGVVAVAGGRHKVTAVSHVLRQSPPWVSHLVTDNYIAHQVLLGPAEPRP